MIGRDEKESKDLVTGPSFDAPPAEQNGRH